MEHLGDSFQKTFSAEVKKHIVETLSKAVSSACENYDPEKGSNGVTFGVDTYQFGIYEFTKLASAFPKFFSVDRSGNLFRLKIGDFIIACHRVGSSESEDINSSFPNSECSAHRMVSSQLFLPGLEPDLTQAKQFVLSHFANSYDGLCAVYICLPKATDGNQISEWAHTHLIWQLDRTNTTAATLKTDELPSPEKVLDFSLRRKKKKDENNLDGNN